jgi:V-type H+-transporting ATPase subunit a
LLEMNSAYEVLSGRLAELVEARHVLRETAVFFQRVSALVLAISSMTTLSPPV